MWAKKPSFVVYWGPETQLCRLFGPIETQFCRLLLPAPETQLCLRLFGPTNLVSRQALARSERRTLTSFERV